MKKIFAIVTAAVSLLAIGTMAACGETATTYTGEYHYASAWGGADYGVKVNVEVTGDKITNVTIAESEYTQLSAANPDYGWTEEARANYTDNEAALLASFVGKTVAEVNAYTVTSTLTGEYKYENPYAPGSYYGVKVSVVIGYGKIVSVSVVESDYTQLSAANPDYGWTDEARANYTNNEAAVLASFAGKTIAEVQAYDVETAESGEPAENGITAEGLTLITGATQSVGRLILAVQNALAGAATAAPGAIVADGITMITGATQSVGRVILAVQNALAQIK